MILEVLQRYSQILRNFEKRSEFQYNLKTHTSYESKNPSTKIVDLRFGVRPFEKGYRRCAERINNRYRLDMRTNQIQLIIKSTMHMKCNFQQLLISNSLYITTLPIISNYICGNKNTQP